MRQELGEELAADVRADPENFADAEAFRNFHAKARFRATFTTLGVFVVGATAAAPSMGFESGKMLLKAHKLMVVPAMVGTWVSTYFFWNRVIGWNHLERNKYLYAKNIRMLRNIQIKQ